VHAIPLLHKAGTQNLDKSMAEGMQSYNGGAQSEYTAMLASSMANELAWPMGSQMHAAMPGHATGIGLTMADQMASNEALMARGLAAQGAGMHMNVGLPGGLGPMVAPNGMPAGALGGFLGGNLDAGVGVSLGVNGQQVAGLGGNLGGGRLEDLLASNLGGNMAGMNPNLGANVAVNMAGHIGGGMPGGAPGAQQVSAMAAAAMMARMHGMGAVGCLHVGGHQRLPVDQAMDPGALRE
jgi:hypothetical protein